MPFDYFASLELTPGIAGRVDVHFTIDPSGSATGTMVLPSTTFPDFAMNTCVADELEKLSFPPPRSGSVDVVYRLVFAPK
jgi:outer membrane biosynthesis protein TonB